MNTAYSLVATIADAGSSPTVSSVYLVNRGAPAVLSNLAAPGKVSATLAAFSGTGVYSVCVRPADLAGNVGLEECIFVPVYDPTGGFVTGGGFIMSPLGAYTPNGTLTGKATFGFVSKYTQGANVPTGNTQFEFKTARMDFRSTSYEWLVVAGARAEFKGTGTINGAGSFSFHLSAIDGDLSGGGGSDKFRIKITGPGGLVYDNMLGADDNADPTTVISGGNIVIHK